MDIGIGLPATIPGTRGSLILDWAERADSGPFSSLGIIDRLVYPNYEPLITLAAAAAVTDRVRQLFGLAEESWRAEGREVSRRRHGGIHPLLARGRRGAHPGLRRGGGGRGGLLAHGCGTRSGRSPGRPGRLAAPDQQGARFRIAWKACQKLRFAASSSRAGARAGKTSPAVPFVQANQTPLSASEKRVWASGWEGPSVSRAAPRTTGTRACGSAAKISSAKSHLEV